MNPPDSPPLDPATPDAPQAEAFGLLHGGSARRFSKVLITGLGRSGTTAVASIVQQWGFFLGSTKTWGVLENPELRQRMLDDDADAVLAELDRWQAGHGRIAWKEPKLFAGPGARLIARLPSDWLVIAVFRDPVPVALRRAKSDGTYFVQALERTSALQSRLADFVSTIDKPTMLVSYERLLTMPEVVLEEITRHLDPGKSAAPSLDAIWGRLMQQRNEYRSNDVKMLHEKARSARPAAWRSQPAPRLATFDALSLRHLNAMLPWATAVPVGPQAVLGTALAAPAEPAPEAGLAAEVEALNRLLPLAGASVLVMRCFEGLRAIALAAQCREVWAVDAHVEYVVKALVRVWLAGLERQVAVHLLDPARSSCQAQLQALGRTEAFDLVVHADALHRLPDPVTELVQCAQATRRHLYLRTWLAGDDLANATFHHETGDYAVFESRAGRPGFAHLVEPAPPARSLTRQSLETAVRAAGFNHLEIVSMRPEALGQAIEIVATR